MKSQIPRFECEQAAIIHIFAASTANRGSGAVFHIDTMSAVNGAVIAFATTRAAGIGASAIDSCLGSAFLRRSIFSVCVHIVSWVGFSFAILLGQRLRLTRAAILGASGDIQASAIADRWRFSQGCKPIDSG